MQKRWFVQYLNGYSQLKTIYVFAATEQDAIAEVKTEPNFKSIEHVARYLTEYERNSKK